MSIPYQSFAIQQGQDVSIPITVVDSAGASVDTTGASARFAMARSPSDDPVVDSSASPQTASVVVAAAAGGPITVTITDTVLDGLEGDYYFECKMTDSSGNESIVARGWMSVESALT